MKICYIAPVASIALEPQSNQGMIEKAISSAIQNTIVEPFCHAVNQAWIKLIDVSYILCLSIAVAGVICGICGIKKGYKWSVVSILFYLFLRTLSYYMGWY